MGDFSPMRTCVGCRKKKAQAELMRVVKNKNGNVAIDFSGKSEGRGAYICKNEECLDKAIKSRGLERSFKMAIQKEMIMSLKEEFHNCEA